LIEEAARLDLADAVAVAAANEPDHVAPPIESKV